MSDEPWYFRHLVCPDCGNPLSVEGGSMGCGGECEPWQFGKPLDLRPRRPIRRQIQHDIGRRPEELLNGLSIEPPAWTYDGPRASRDSGELFSAALPRLKPGMALLDLGCGPRDQAVVAEHLRLRYVGVDYTSPASDLLADAHAIPFGSEVFDAVFAYAVLEHLQDPLVALAEIRRVLSPGGTFFGTVSQGEPFHDSFFHMTAWGVLTLFDQAGFTVESVWPTRDTLGALAKMGRYPRVVRSCLAGLDALHRKVPMLSPRKALRWSRRERRLDQMHRTGSIAFLVRKAEAVNLGPGR